MHACARERVRSILLEICVECIRTLHAMCVCERVCVCTLDNECDVRVSARASHYLCTLFVRWRQFKFVQILPHKHTSSLAGSGPCTCC
jgi:hypothetical protein